MGSEVIHPAPPPIEPTPTPHRPAPTPIRPALDWFASRGWSPFPFQLQAWNAYLAGHSGLVHAPTGMGKTYSAWIGPILESLAEHAAQSPRRPAGGTPRTSKVRRDTAPPLRVLWLTPLRALAADLEGSLRAAADGLHAGWTVELRTGDSSASLKARQRRRLPTALVTTPESLALLLTYADATDSLRSLRCVVVDEWHELMGTKRGVQTELALAHLRAINPRLRTWGLSATLGNLDEAAHALLGSSLPSQPAPPDSPAPRSAALMIRGVLPKPLDVTTLIPESIERFPWAGHLGIRLLPRVLERIESASTSLIFTNTRSQAEIWFQSILRQRPDWLGRVALHHGSLDRGLRDRVEDGLRDGSLKAVVCTSSLDLGVDFQPVDQVIQIGSPKGVSRLLQRAGRSGHRPGAESRIVCVPTNAMELVEFAAARGAIAQLRLESRGALRLTLDVLVQHLVGLGCAGAWDGQAVLDEIRSTHAFAELSDEQWRWCVDFCLRGGASLRAYPQYARLTEEPASTNPAAPGLGRYRVASEKIARLHRLNVGTIASDVSMAVRLRGGKTLGHVEEGFIAAMHVGEVFTFAGRVLRLLRVRDMAAIVEPATRKSGRVPTWQGARMPLSSELSAALRERIARSAAGQAEGPEMAAAAPLLALQADRSHLPAQDELLIESTKTREGHHLFVYPFEGRLVHEGLGALLAYRLARQRPSTFSIAANDHGFELASPEPIIHSETQWRELLSTEGLVDDVLASLNAAQLARRVFRDIARVAGLIIPGFPGASRSTRHVQASSDLFYDVFTEFDPDNLLLDQARREVLERQMEFSRLREALLRMAAQRLILRTPALLTPFAFPLWADSLREQLTSERWTDRVGRMLQQLEQDAQAQPPARRRRQKAPLPTPPTDPPADQPPQPVHQANDAGPVGPASAPSAPDPVVIPAPSRRRGQRATRRTPAPGAANQQGPRPLNPVPPTPSPAGASRDVRA
jgi:ATP-dependent Lhr-like helicase